MRAQLLFLYAASGCQVSPDSPSVVEAEQALDVEKSIQRPAEAKHVQIGEQNAHFAGYYCEDGNLLVGVTASATSSDVAEIVSLVKGTGASFYCRTRRYPDHEPQIVTVTKPYSFMQLRTWRDDLVANYDTNHEVHSIGISNKKNVVRVKGMPGTVQSHLSSLAARGIPPTALEVTADEPGHDECNPPSTSTPLTRDCFRPVPGGVRTRTYTSGGSSKGTCTLAIAGKHLVYPYQGNIGFVTAAHCLAPVGSDQDDKISQPEYLADYIGTETIDAPSFYVGCYPGVDCKYSDSVWVEHTGGVAQLGQIARTQTWNGTSTCCDTGCSACLVSATSPRFQVYGPADLVEGMDVEKVGDTSGWTSGTLVDDCNDEYSFNSGVVYTCMGIANYLHDNGDSGSPVFYWWSNLGVNTVTLLGVHSGMQGGGNARFSSWDQVTHDLGNIDVRFAPGWSLVSGEPARDVGVGSDGHVWIITNTAAGGGNYLIKRRNASGAWGNMPGAAVRIAVDPNGDAWAVNAANQIYKWAGSTWTAMPGLARDIGIGANGSVWRVTTTPTGGGYTISVWTGTSWTGVAGGAVRISVDPSGNPWITASDYTIWRYSAGVWTQVAGTATDVGISGDGMVWILGTSLSGYGYPVYWWSGYNWQLVEGYGTSIGAERGGRPWVTNTAQNLWRGL